jgi:hypothetical protein
MGYRWLSVLCGYSHLEHTKGILCHGSSLAVPVVEVTNQICSERIGCPFSVYNVAIVLDVET